LQLNYVNFEDIETRAGISKGPLAMGSFILKNDGTLTLLSTFNGDDSSYFTNTGTITIMNVANVTSVPFGCPVADHFINHGTITVLLPTTKKIRFLNVNNAGTLLTITGNSILLIKIIVFRICRISWYNDSRRHFSDRRWNTNVYCERKPYI
jgi:hypothetical protein